MWTVVTIILGSLALFFIIAALLLEITKIRRALEHMAYKKEIHEIIETDYLEEDGDIPADPENTSGVGEGVSKAAVKPKFKPMPVKRFRKTKIKVVAEEE